LLAKTLSFETHQVTRNFILLKVFSDGEPFFVSNVYAPPNDKLSVGLHASMSIKKIRDGTKNLNLVFAGDLNRRGKDTMRTELSTMKAYYSTLGRIGIDCVAVAPKTTRLLMNEEYGINTRLSDHSIIYGSFQF